MTGREWDADVTYKAAVQDYRRRRFRSNVQAPLLEPVQQHVAATAPLAVPPPTPLPSPPSALHSLTPASLSDQVPAGSPCSPVFLADLAEHGLLTPKFIEAFERYQNGKK